MEQTIRVVDAKGDILFSGKMKGTTTILEVKEKFK